MSNRTPARATTRSRRGAQSGMWADVEGGWSRSRLLGVLIAAGAAVVVLLAGLGFTVSQALGASDGAGDGSHVGPGVGGSQDAMYSDVALGAARRDEIAAASMAEAPAAAVNPTDEAPAPGSDLEPDLIAIPSGVVPGPAAVLTGYPRTPQGAVGQLAAIETTVLQSMSLASASDVYEAWALPGGTGPQAWPLTTSVRAFLDGAGMEETKDQSATVSIEPAGALVKGTDGPDWTLACALVTVTASLEQEVQIGYGHCERMQWVGGRWMIAPGTPPTTAPSTWPGSPAAAEAGWSTWTTDTSDTGAGDGVGEA